MYDIEWDADTGGFLLVDKTADGSNNEIRPVFHEELDLLGFDKYWQYPKANEPLLWAVGARKYYYRGELVAEAEGGAMFSPPNLRIYKNDIRIVPTNVQKMVAKNSAVLQGLVQQALRFIWQTYAKRGRDVDIVTVAFSGGKDSMVILDLVQRTLEPDQFVVVFGDTGMEVRDTYLAVKEAQARWPYLRFYTARSRKDALTTWREMGPPSRIHRWCHAVHKTAPTLLLLRELTGKPAVKVLVFDGVRKEESLKRSGYSELTPGGKHKLQINASPILRWNAGEVFLYIFSRQLYLNRAYRYGCVRVGCAVCPMASRWRDLIFHSVYVEDTDPFLRELEGYALAAGVPDDELKDYMNQGGWKGRGGGRYLDEGGIRVIEQKEGQDIRFILRNPSEDWWEWAEVLGEMVRIDGERGLLHVNGATYPYTVKDRPGGITVEVQGLGEADRFTQSHFRAVAVKSAYCSHCQACAVECATGALEISDKVKILDTCTHCASCLNVRGHCLRAKSLVTSREGQKMGEKIILHTYQEFGIRREWLHEFFHSADEWFHRNTLGNRQFDAMMNWLRHAEVITRTKNGLQITELGEKLRRMGADDPLTWAIIWVNLIRNSTPVRWYVLNVPWGTSLAKSRIVAKMAENFPQQKSTRNNAATALLELLQKTPLGGELGMGLKEGDKRKGDQMIYKKGWETPHSTALLYSLYRYAEKTGRYEFTVSELYGGAEEGPYVAFGVSQEALRGILRGMSAQGGSLLRVNIVRDLDNIFLDPGVRAWEVLDSD